MEFEINFYAGNNSITVGYLLRFTLHGTNFEKVTKNNNNKLFSTRQVDLHFFFRMENSSKIVSKTETEKEVPDDYDVIYAEIDKNALGSAGNPKIVVSDDRTEYAQIQH